MAPPGCISSRHQGVAAVMQGRPDGACWDGKISLYRSFEYFHIKIIEGCLVPAYVAQCVIVLFVCVCDGTSVCQTNAETSLMCLSERLICC